MTKTIYFIVVLVVGAIICIPSCSKTTVEEAGGSNSCDTTHVSFQADVVPILESYCYSCHSNNNKIFSNGISLEGYDNFKTWSATAVGAISHDPGSIGMPYGKPKLPDCSINKITGWFNQGGLNN